MLLARSTRYLSDVSVVNRGPETDGPPGQNFSHSVGGNNFSGTSFHEWGLEALIPDVCKISWKIKVNSGMSYKRTLAPQCVHGMKREKKLNSRFPFSTYPRVYEFPYEEKVQVYEFPYEEQVQVNEFPYKRRGYASTSFLTKGKSMSFLTKGKSMSFFANWEAMSLRVFLRSESL